MGEKPWPLGEDFSSKRGSCKKGGALIREICKANKVEILEGYVSADHIHLFVPVPPHLSVIKLMQMLKGKISIKMLFQFKTLEQQFWGRPL